MKTLDVQFAYVIWEIVESTPSEIHPAFGSIIPIFYALCPSNKLKFDRYVTNIVLSPQILAVTLSQRKVFRLAGNAWIQHVSKT